MEMQGPDKMERLDGLMLVKAYDQRESERCCIAHEDKVDGGVLWRGYAASW